MRLPISVLPVLIAVGLACRGEKAADPTPRPPPAAPEPTPTPVEPSGPEVVEVPIPADEVPPDDCVAVGVDGGALDETSAAYRRIEVKRHEQYVWQKATLTSGRVVTAQVGGCAHHGAHYTLRLPKSRPVGDKAHYLGAALGALGALPLRAGSTNFRDELTRELRAALDDPARLEDCSFPSGEMVTILCGVVEDADTGEILVSLGYDIAL